mmetsp:Transcript_45113/g.130532  ORF Transcript_45113/g.130532 Transcript_45113/m.130532 type:complete len:258 (+) Transcript_45113:896-1669(+)
MPTVQAQALTAQTGVRRYPGAARRLQAHPLRERSQRQRLCASGRHLLVVHREQDHRHGTEGGPLDLCGRGAPADDCQDLKDHREGAGFDVHAAEAPGRRPGQHLLEHRELCADDAAPHVHRESCGPPVFRHGVDPWLLEHHALGRAAHVLHQWRRGVRVLGGGAVAEQLPRGDRRNGADFEPRESQGPDSASTYGHAGRAALGSHWPRARFLACRPLSDVRYPWQVASSRPWPGGAAASSPRAEHRARQDLFVSSCD